jgi:2-polyprenyl-6-hydroxyphenyl methylase/3-demethylubiquinone-9 3-methyltransferase
MQVVEAARTDSSHLQEVKRGERFEFGKNWQRFLDSMSEERIVAAECSLQRMLERPSLAGTRFVDVGSGSGLFSLAASRLGADVHSFDFDPNSVACTTELRRRYASQGASWTIDEASVLDRSYINTLREFDVVYSWGVLHHTGRMWEALDNVRSLVAPRGKLYVAIYNDLGSRSLRWRWVKRTYNRLPGFLRAPYAALVISPTELKAFTRAAASGRLREYLSYRGGHIDTRGMSRWRDIIDWVGGFPYEFAAPDAIFDFCRERGFSLSRLVCGGVGFGCNEYVFERVR